jgi:hypothetical protein
MLPSLDEIPKRDAELHFDAITLSNGGRPVNAVKEQTVDCVEQLTFATVRRDI